MGRLKVLNGGSTIVNPTKSPVTVRINRQKTDMVEIKCLILGQNIFSKMKIRIIKLIRVVVWNTISSPQVKVSNPIPKGTKKKLKIMSQIQIITLIKKNRKSPISQVKGIFLPLRFSILLNIKMVRMIPKTSITDSILNSIDSAWVIDIYTPDLVFTQNWV